MKIRKGYFVLFLALIFVVAAPLSAMADEISIDNELYAILSNTPPRAATEAAERGLDIIKEHAFDNGFFNLKDRSEVDLLTINPDGIRVYYLYANQVKDNQSLFASLSPGKGEAWRFQIYFDGQPSSYMVVEHNGSEFEMIEYGAAHEDEILYEDILNSCKRDISTRGLNGGNNVVAIMAFDDLFFASVLDNQEVVAPAYGTTTYVDMNPVVTRSSNGNEAPWYSANDFLDDFEATVDAARAMGDDVGGGIGSGNHSNTMMYVLLFGIVLVCLSALIVVRKRRHTN